MGKLKEAVTPPSPRKPIPDKGGQWAGMEPVRTAGEMGSSRGWTAGTEIHSQRENSWKMERAGPLPSSPAITDLSEQHHLERGAPGPGPAQPLTAADTTMTLLPELGNGICRGEDRRGRWTLMNTNSSSVTKHSADTRAH